MIRMTMDKLIFITLVTACLLMIVPLPDVAATMRPDFVTLVLMYWWLAHPEKVGVITAFIVGILLDIIYGSILGRHAIGLVVIAWIYVKKYQSIRVLPLVQQAVIVGFALLLKQFITLWAGSRASYDIGLMLLYFSPSLLGAILWPWLFILLRDLRRRISRSL